MNCQNCNWRWDIEKDDTDPSLCHKCGYNSELGKFDMESLRQWEKENNHPFDEYVEEGYHIRTFSKEIDDTELVWHRDKEDRIVESVDETDWMIQIDNEIPKVLTEKIYIPKGVYHRVIKGTDDVTVKVKKLNENNNLFNLDKKNDERFYRKVLNYVVENLGTKIIKNIKSYIYCKDLHCSPLTQTNGFKKVINFLKEEFQLNKDEQQLLFLLLIFNLDVKNFLTDPLDYGKGYNLHHVSHTAQSIERDEEWVEDDCQMCDGEGVANYQDYDTPQECVDCSGFGTVHNQTIGYRLDYYMSSFLSKNSLIIPDGEFSEDEFKSINKDNGIIHYIEKLDEVMYSDSRHFDQEEGMVLSIESANYFDIHDLDLTTL
jgi:hypothetical protein